MHVLIVGEGLGGLTLAQSLRKQDISFEIFERDADENADKPESTHHHLEHLELESLPAGRVLLVADAAHAMTPIQGEGGYHTLIDTRILSKLLGELDTWDKFKGFAAIQQAIASYNDEMLKRSGQALRDSRNLHANAARVGPDGKPFVVEMMSLPDVEILLGAED